MERLVLKMHHFTLNFLICEGTDAGRCAWASCGNDIGFIKKIIDDVKEKYNLNKIYLVGMSNGGMMAHAFAL